MSTPLATADDLADYWRPLTEQESAVADSLLMVASALIRRRVPDIDAQISAGTIEPVLVLYVIAEMVKSAIDASARPVDARSVSNTVGPFTQSITYEATSQLFFTDELAALLLGIAPVATVGSARLGAAGPPSVPTWGSCRPTGWPSS